MVDGKPKSMPSEIRILRSQLEAAKADINFQCSIREAAVEENERLKQQIATLTEALQRVKTGDCWCLVGIGHPQMRCHSAACENAQATIAAVRGEKR